MAQTNWLCFILFSVLFTSQQIVAAIDLARLYGHEGHEVQKRSGNYSIHFRSDMRECVRYRRDESYGNFPLVEL